MTQGDLQKEGTYEHVLEEPLTFLATPGTCLSVLIKPAEGKLHEGNVLGHQLSVP